LKPAFNPKEIEGEVRGYWEEIDVKRLIREAVADKSPTGYVEGPPTMNGEPHIGHIRGRILKDLWYRFNTLKGRNIVFRAGWDTQGLPVELQAERELGLTGSKAENLKAVGEEKIVEACKQLIAKYSSIWLEADRLLGMSMDYERAYWTYKDEYIEREWRYLEQAWKKGLLGEGYRVVPYCPSCQCSLSHAEVGQGYEQVSDPSIYFKMKLSGEERYLVLWTTMPFTVVTDELVGVKPDEEYATVEVSSERWVVALSRVEALMHELGIGDYRVLGSVRGSELEGLKYEYPLAKHVPKQVELEGGGEVHRVVAEDFVDVTTGSGIVHLSPANGEEDFEVAKKRGVPVFNPIDDQARFTSDAGVFEGLYVRDADDMVVELLKQEGLLISIGKITHDYPTCWRSHHKLVWIARREYFYWVDMLGDLALKAAEDVKYFYEPPRNRFLEIIKEKVPWCISRERVWGTPLPIWVCTSCHEKIAVFSRKEIVERAVELPDGPDFELHRPWIDRVTLRCHSCGGVAKREPYVLDTWHNSGAAPYASFTDEEYKELVPVEFLTEGIDQTRGWAYTLLVEHVIMTGEARAPYRAFLFQGHILDENGNKMSKSLGNIIEGVPALKANPVDILRFYMVWKAGPLDSLNFSFKEMKARPYQVLSVLYHLHVYFQQNSSYDGFDYKTHTLRWAAEEGLLRPQELWLLSRLQRAVSVITLGYEECRFHEAARAFERFLIDDVSQAYVPMTRSEIWDDSPETLKRRLGIYTALAHVLKTLDILIHPVSPYITEYLFQKCFRGWSGTIATEPWPRVDEDLIDRRLESEFQEIMRLISLVNSTRMKARLKRRWPLRSLIVFTDHAERLRNHAGLIRELANVKEIEITSKLSETPIGVEVRPRYDVLGSRLKTKIHRLATVISHIDAVRLHSELKRSGAIRVYVDGEAVELSREEVEVKYTSTDKRYAVAEGEGVVIALQIERDSELIAEGVVRDMARRIQSMRKKRGFNPTDILDTAYLAGLEPEVEMAIQPRLGELAYLVRVKEIKVMKEAVEGVRWEDVEIDGRHVKISVE